MNVHFPFREQVEAISASLAQAINGIVAGVGASWDKEHKDDATHGAVTADNVTTRGAYYEKSRTAAIGYMTDVLSNHDASRYTASGTMTWTVQAADVIYYKYTRLGNLVFLLFHIGGTDIGGVVSTTLYLPLPAGISPRQMDPSIDLLQENYCRIIDNGTSVTGRCFVETPDTPVRLGITRVDGANLTASASNTGVRGQIWFEAAP